MTRLPFTQGAAAVLVDQLVQGGAARPAAGPDVAGRRLGFHDVDVGVGQDCQQVVGRVPGR
jgi:hypothetical protein